MNYSEIDAKIETGLKDRFMPEEAEKIRKFLEGFSPRGKIVVASIFFFARGSKKSADEVLKVCEEQMEKIWKFQHPDARGDPDAPGTYGNYGRNNRLALEDIYEKLGIKSPMALREEKMAKAKIPESPFVVRTRNSTYFFGEKEQNEERAVSRKPQALNFTRCIIRHLLLREAMKLIEINGKTPNNDIFVTSSVTAIKRPEKVTSAK